MRFALIKMKFCTFEDDGHKMVEQSIPEELEEIARIARMEMIDPLSNFSNELMF